jgi:hypothetical protein
LWRKVEKFDRKIDFMTPRKWKKRFGKCILLKLFKKTTFRRQNAQIIGRMTKNTIFEIAGGVPVFGTFWGPFCLCFAVFRHKYLSFYNGRPKVLLCAFVTRFTRNFAKVRNYKNALFGDPISHYKAQMGVKKRSNFDQKSSVNFLDLVDTTI